MFLTKTADDYLLVLKRLDGPVFQTRFPLTGKGRIGVQRENIIQESIHESFDSI